MGGPKTCFLLNALQWGTAGLASCINCMDSMQYKWVISPIRIRIVHQYLRKLCGHSYSMTVRTETNGTILNNKIYYKVTKFNKTCLIDTNCSNYDYPSILLNLNIYGWHWDAPHIILYFLIFSVVDKIQASWMVGTAQQPILIASIGRTWWKAPCQWVQLVQMRLTKWQQLPISWSDHSPNQAVNISVTF